MFTFYKYEMKSGLKSFLIWVLAVGGMGLACILLFKSMEESMAGMAQSFSSMGGFAQAFGMDILSVATITGFFATEVGTVHALGSSMYAASAAATILSKEEDGHTAEFTYTLPLVRNKITVSKYLALVSQLVLFAIVCGALYEIGFLIIGDSIDFSKMVEYLASQLFMNIEIATICFAVSAFCKKNKIGVGIGIAMMLYFYDLIIRAVSDFKDYLFVTPFSYANAAEIFSGMDKNVLAICVGAVVIVACMVLGTVYYSKKDLAS